MSGNSSGSGGGSSSSSTGDAAPIFTPRIGIAASKPHSDPKEHNQPIADPVAHFQSIPWCAALLNDKENIDVLVPDRRPLPSGESNFVRQTMNTSSTVRACVTFFRVLRPAAAAAAPPTATKGPAPAVLAGGGRAHGEDARNPFVLFTALLDLGAGCAGYARTLHGGVVPVILDEVMGTAANLQSPHGAYTVRFTTDYRRAVATPQVVAARGRVVRKDGRKLHVRGALEDKDGNILAEAEGLWLCMAHDVGRSKM